MKNKYDKYLNYDVNFERFKEFVRESKVGTLNPDKNIQQAMLGLIGEWGEVADIFKKHIFIGKGLRYERSGTSEKINKTED